MFREAGPSRLCQLVSWPPSTLQHGGLLQLKDVEDAEARIVLGSDVSPCSLNVVLGLVMEPYLGERRLGKCGVRLTAVSQWRTL